VQQASLQVKPLLDAAVRLQSSGQLQEAAQLCERALAMYPEHIEAMNLLAQVLQQAGQHAHSELILRRALQRAPEHAASYVNITSVLNAQGKFDEAVSLSEVGLRRFPDNKLLVNNLAVNLEGAGRFEEALALLQKRIKAHPRYAGGHYHLGILNRKLDRIEDAARHFAEAAKLEPRNLHALTAAADCLLRLSKPAEALAPLDAVLRLSPWHVRALALKTVALAGAGREKEERWLADPHRLVQAVHFSELGCTGEELQALNARLSAYAAAHPSMRIDPPENATYNGRHSGNLAADPEPALARLKELVSHALRRRRETLSAEDASHPFRRAAPPAFALHLWSVQLSAGGNMTPHIHTDGWLSGVYYVDVPDVVHDPAAGEAGWIRFGVPLPEHAAAGTPTARSVKPEPGLMLTFPSYLWHATVPLPADTVLRLCYSYDLQPRPAPISGPYSIA
jgi:tetratricopeptide (TPR) repeat protein